MTKFLDETPKLKKKSWRFSTTKKSKNFTLFLSVLVLLTPHTVKQTSAAYSPNEDDSINDEEIALEVPRQEGPSKKSDDSNNLNDDIKFLLLLQKIYPSLFSYRSDNSLYEPRELRARGWQLRASKRADNSWQFRTGKRGLDNNWQFRTGKRGPDSNWQFRTGKRGPDSNWQFRTGKRGPDSNWQFRTGKRGPDSSWQFRTGKRGLDNNWQFRTGKRGLDNNWQFRTGKRSSGNNWQFRTGKRSLMDNFSFLPNFWYNNDSMEENDDQNVSDEDPFNARQLRPGRSPSWQFRTGKRSLDDFKRDNLWKLRSGK